MSTAQLKAAAGGKSITAMPLARQFPAMLEQFKTEIARALPKHLNADRMARIALTCFRQNAKLAQCQPASVFASVIQASQLGLEPGLLGQCYLIPYKDECTLQIGYQGLVDLVRRTGRVKRIEAHVVRDGDKFIYRTGMTTTLEHEPSLDGDPGDLRLAYAVAEFTDGGFHVEVMTRHQIETIRDRSQNVQNAKKFGKATPWTTDTEEMWRKTVLRRICKYLPRSPELATALALDEAPKQSLNVEDAINGTWAPVAEDEPVTGVEMVDRSTGEIMPAGQEQVDPRNNPEYADWCSAIDSCATLSDIARLVHDMPPEVKKALQHILHDRQASIKDQKIPGLD
jgi:recombination protein RecT